VTNRLLSNHRQRIHTQLEWSRSPRTGPDSVPNPHGGGRPRVYTLLYGTMRDCRKAEEVV